MVDSKNVSPRLYLSFDYKYHSTLGVIVLKNNILEDINEYQRKLELGREVKRIVKELNTPKVGLRREFVEALEIFSKHEYEEWRG